MFLWFTSILTLAAAAADIIHYRRLRRRGTSARNLRLFVALAAATDALPPVIALTDALSRDNTTGFMLFAMWAFWVWMITVLPRIACYFFRLVGLPRAGIAAGICVAAAPDLGHHAGQDANPRQPHRSLLRTDSRGIRRFPHRPVLGRPPRHARLPRSGAEPHRGQHQQPASRPRRLLRRSGQYPRFGAGRPRHGAWLGGLRAPYGVVAVTGNHDAGVYIKDSIAHPAQASLAEVVARQREMGWRVLEDTTVYLRRGGDSISLTGLSFDPALRHLRHAPDLPPANLNAAYRGVPDSLYNITAVHIPQLWDQIAGEGYGDLTLSGHVHSMQLKIGLFGHAFSPAQLIYTRWSGRYDEKGRTLYINDGTGYVAFPMRLGAWPEITLITLKRCG